MNLEESPPPSKPTLDSQQMDESTLSPSKLLEQTVRDAAQIDTLLKKMSPDAQELQVLRNTLRDQFHKIMLEHPLFAQSHDSDHLLWRSVYYRSIEEFRKMIKKYHRQTDKLKRTQAKFSQFLSDASKDYDDLFQKRQQQKSNASSSEIRKAITLSLHRTCIILGDLARYYEYYIQEESKDWSMAATYYMKALDILPDNGNAHNQLAVLAHYENDEFEAAYRYFRSLAVKKPFKTARENLILISEDNRQKFLKFSQAMQSNGSRSRGRNIIAPRQAPTIDLPELSIHERFLLRFVRVHAILFTKIDVDLIEGILPSTIDDFHRLLIDDNHHDEMFILKLFTINIFQIDDILRHRNDESSQPILLKYACDLAFALFSRALYYSYEHRFAHLSAISIFMEYLEKESTNICDESVFEEPAAPTHKSRKRDLTTLQIMWSTLANFLNRAKSFDKRSQTKDDDLKPKTLPEDVELRGFLPLQNRSRKSNVAGDEPVPVLNAIRMHRIKNSAQQLSSIQSLPLNRNEDRYTTPFQQKFKDSRDLRLRRSESRHKKPQPPRSKEIERPKEKQDSTTPQWSTILAASVNKEQSKTSRINTSTISARNHVEKDANESPNQQLASSQSNTPQSSEPTVHDVESMFLSNKFFKTPLEETDEEHDSSAIDTKLHLLPTSPTSESHQRDTALLTPTSLLSTQPASTSTTINSTNDDSSQSASKPNSQMVSGWNEQHLMNSNNANPAWNVQPPFLYGNFSEDHMQLFGSQQGFHPAYYGTPSTTTTPSNAWSNQAFYGGTGGGVWSSMGVPPDQSHLSMMPHSGAFGNAFPNTPPMTQQEQLSSLYWYNQLQQQQQQHDNQKT